MKITLSRRLWLPLSTALLVVFTIMGIASSTGASLPISPATLQSLGTIAQDAQGVTDYDDGFDALPPGLKGVSYSTLAMSGKVHPPKAAPSRPSTWKNPFAPLLTIVWGPERDTSASSQGEPAAGIHPTNPLYALVSGNFSIDHTTDAGVTWTSVLPPNPHNSGDVVNAWLECTAPCPNALEMAINNGGAYDYTCARTTDYGVTWTTDAACGASVSTPYFDDREYIWVDRNVASPFYGRVYVTTALFDAAGTGSFVTMSNRWSSDNGTSWNPPGTSPLALVPNNEFALGLNHNEYPSLGISANGTLGYLWHRGLCCGSSPTVGTNNKVMFARSNDGGASFPFSTTVVTVPANQSISFNSTSPLGVRWSDTPNIAADPVTNGVFYAIWTQYRTPSVAASSAIYLSRTTDNGATWSTPLIPYNNPNPNIFQGFGWVKVTADHAVHLTFLSGTTNNTTVAQFYVQSTNGGTSWSAPFQLSSTTFGPFAITTDYNSMDVTLGSGPGVILATWAENHHYARGGTFIQGTPTPTVTGTPPTATRTRTPTLTPTATPTVCGGNSPYSIATATSATVVPGTTFVPGSNCDDCSSAIALPFPFRLYDQTFNSVNAISNGNLQFNTTDTTFTNTCLPDTLANYAIFPHWDDLCTGPCNASTCTGCGVFTSVSGTAPNRIFNIEWRANYFNTNTPLNFEVRLYESSTTARFDVIYGTLNGTGSSATVGVQKDTGSMFTQYECNTAGSLSAGLMLTFTQPPCNPPTSTPPPSPTSTVCPIQFTDVPNPSTFYVYIRCLACRNIVNGYADGTFRPNNNVTRGQLSKIVSNSAGFNDPQTTQMFEDVPPSGPNSTFFVFIGRLASRGYISGYACGGPGEPCIGPSNRPYFRPNNNATRGQISKIDSNAAGFSDPPSGQQFQDVPPGSTYYTYTYRLVSRSIMSGYACGGTTPPEPCIPPLNLPYFRPNNNATRGQTSKIVANTFFPGCDTPNLLRR